MKVIFMLPCLASYFGHTLVLLAYPAIDLFLPQKAEAERYKTSCYRASASVPLRLSLLNF
jgi:hypothetical protein